ncbi:MAG: leucyl aminopeptidase [Polyangiaceae bacterium]|nr:leucyl aminopeptidase [Polyangiaceae bacterium]
MELRFVAPELRLLDALESEVLACAVWSDERPAEGVAGLCDFRLAGTISHLFRTGFLSGERGEVLLLPGRPKLGFAKVLLFGAGPRASFDEGVFLEVLRRMLRAIDDLAARIAVVELPGRTADLVPAERAADALLEAAGRGHEHSVWTLVEDAAARARITQHTIEQRRRIRRAP